jgi:hypothetical protein
LKKRCDFFVLSLIEGNKKKSDLHRFF